MIPIDGAAVWRAKAERGFVPTWCELLEAAARDGTDTDRLIRNLCFFVRESYAPEFAVEVTKRLRWFLR